MRHPPLREEVGCSICSGVKPRPAKTLRARDSGSPCSSSSSHDKFSSSHASSINDRWDNTSSCGRDVALSSPLSSSRLRWKNQEEVMNVISWASTSRVMPPEKPRRTQDKLALLKHAIKSSSLDQAMHKLPLSSPRVSTRKLPKALQGLPYSSECATLELP